MKILKAQMHVIGNLTVYETFQDFCRENKFKYKHYEVSYDPSMNVSLVTFDKLEIDNKENIFDNYFAKKFDKIFDEVTKDDQKG